MRIALCAWFCPPGGMQHYTSQLAGALAPRADVHLFTPPREDLAPYLGPGVLWHPTLRLTEPGQTWRNYARQLNACAHAENARRVRAIRPDVVHFVTEHAANALMWPWLRDLPLVLTVHDPRQHPGETSRLKAGFNALARRGATRLVVHAEALKAELAAQGVGAARIATIPHGDYGFLRRHAMGAPEAPMVLFFGRLVRYKGLDTLCRAERLLADRLADYEVRIAGEGDTACFADQIGPSGRLVVDNRFLPDEEVARLFEQARLVVLPYEQASQSGVAAIALAFGKPLVVTKVGGLPEAVGCGEAGVIVPPGDPEALAAAIEALWHDGARRARLGAAGRRLVERHTGWRHIADRHLALYREAAEFAAAGGRDAAYQAP